MTRMFGAVAIAICCTFGPTGAFAGAPTHVIFESSFDEVVTFCDFSVRVQIHGPVAVIIFTDREGNLQRTVEPVAGRLQVTVTNLDTGKALNLHTSGPGQFERLPDGGFSFTTLGPWLGFVNPETLEFGVFLIQGKQTKIFPATGDLVVEFEGRVTDLCAELASE
jgi:hypothetical protein